MDNWVKENPLKCLAGICVIAGVVAVNNHDPLWLALFVFFTFALAFCVYWQGRTSTTPTPQTDWRMALVKAVQEYVSEGIGQNDKPMLIKDELLHTIPAIVVVELSRMEREAEQAQLDMHSYLMNRFNTATLTHIMGDVFIEALGNYNRTLISYVGEKGLPAKLDHVPHWKAIDEFYHAFKRDGSISANEDRLFYKIFLEYYENWRIAEEGIKSQYYDRGSTKYYAKLLEGLHFRQLFEGTVNVKIPTELWTEGCWILAPKGRGKTTLLSNLLEMHLEEVKEKKASIITMDIKGELTQLKYSERFGKNGSMYGKLIFIDPWEDLALNPLDLPGDQAVFAMRYLLNSLVDTDTSEKMKGLLTKVVLAVKTIPDANLETLLDFLQEWKKYFEYVQKLRDPSYFTKGMFDSGDNKKTREALWWRIDTFLDEVPRMRSMFRAKTNVVNIGLWMNEGKVIVINNSNKPEDGLGGGAEFFSRYFLMLILNAGESRNGSEKPVYLYFDEADKIIGKDEMAAEIINRLRSRKVCLIAAHQSISQIENQKVLSALQDCSIIFANPQTDAAKIQHLMHVSARELQGYQRGEFALWMYNQPSMPVRITLEIPGKHINGWKKMPIEDYSAYRAQMRKMFCVPIIEKSPEDPDTTPSRRLH